MRKNCLSKLKLRNYNLSGINVSRNANIRNFVLILCFFECIQINYEIKKSPNFRIKTVHQTICHFVTNLTLETE